MVVLVVLTQETKKETESDVKRGEGHDVVRVPLCVYFLL